MIKVEGDSKRGVVMPALISESKIKLKSDTGMEQTNEKIIYTLLNVQN